MKKILFVCLGNICRSPAAEAVMNALLEKRQLQDQFSCDSAGTSSYHAGEPADSRMRAHGEKRGYAITSIARAFDPQKDFEEFDSILAMDESNYLHLLQADSDEHYRDKIFQITRFCKKHSFQEVPDPYYGGAKGFETVLDLLEDACEGLLEELLRSQ